MTPLQTYIARHSGREPIALIRGNQELLDLFVRSVLRGWLATGRLA